MLIEWGIINFTGFVLGTIGIILLPGPNSLFVLALAVQNRSQEKSKTSLWQQVKMPVSAALGIMVGDFILAGISILGAASLLQKHVMLFEAVKYLGAFYLAYLAFGMLKQAYQAYIEYRKNIKLKAQETSTHSQPSIKKDFEESLEEELTHALEADLQNTASQEKVKKDLHPTQPFDAFKTALSISLLNPKAIFFFIAFFIQFLKPNYQPFWLPALILVLVLQVISMSYLSSLIFLGSRLIIAFKNHPSSKFIGFALVGVLFLYFSLQLFLAKI